MPMKPQLIHFWSNVSGFQEEKRKIEITWEPNLSPLEEEQGLLTIEPSIFSAPGLACNNY